MVAMTKSSSRERLASLINSAKSASDIPSKLQTLRQLNQILQQQENANSLSEFLPRIFEFQSDQHSPVRKFATE
jgi:symplekin